MSFLHPRDPVANDKGGTRDRLDHTFRIWFRRPLRWLHIHLVIALIAALLLGPVFLATGFYAGFQAGKKYDAAYFAQRYKHPGLKPPSQPSSPLPPLATAFTTPATASIQIAHYPGVGDQGSVGSCAAWASAWNLSYEFRVSHLATHPGIRFSPRCEYDHYSCTYNQCQDAGSTPEQDVEEFSARGIARYKIVPYGASAPNAIPNLAPYAVEQPPSACYLNGAQWEEPLHVYDITPYQLAPGMTAVTLMKQVIAGQGTADGKPHGVMIAFEVLSTYDGATYQPNIVPSVDGYSRGGHENVVLAYDDTRLMPDGTVGAALVQNQWGTAWGASGRAWLSYSYIARYSFGMSYLTLGGTAKPAAGRGTPADGGLQPLTPLATAPPPPPSFAIPNGPAAVGWYVRGPIRAHDSGVDIAPLINSIGTRWNIWPVYLLAVAMAESGLNQYAKRLGVPPDVSFGFVQVTVQTLATYYGGCGNNYACAAAYLYDPVRAFDLGAHILSDYRSISGVGYPALWECYNAGPGSCQSPYYGAFLQNYNIALTYATSSPGPLPTPKPAPKRFPAKHWHSWCVTHPHKPCQPYRWHGHISWAASVWLGSQRIGGVVGHEVYYAHRRGFTKTTFVHGAIFCWAKFHTCKVTRS